MDGRIYTYLERSVRDRQRDLLAEAARLAAARQARPEARRGWRSAVAAVGRALARFGGRLESLERPRAAGPQPARRWERPPARPPGPVVSAGATAPPAATPAVTAARRPAASAPAGR